MDALGPAAGEVAQLLVDATGQNTVPNIIVTGRHVGGYAELRDLCDCAGSGELRRERRGTMPQVMASSLRRQGRRKKDAFWITA